VMLLTNEALTIYLPIVYLVIFHLKRKLPLGEFFRLINNKPLACNLLQVYCKEQDRELLKDFYYQDDRRIESANLSLEESFGETVRH
jgi:vacuolar protein sorting-associated protein 16